MRAFLSFNMRLADMILKSSIPTPWVLCGYPIPSASPLLWHIKRTASSTKKEQKWTSSSIQRILKASVPRVWIYIDDIFDWATRSAPSFELLWLRLTWPLQPFANPQTDLNMQHCCTMWPHLYLLSSAINHQAQTMAHKLNSADLAGCTPSIDMSSIAAFLA